MNYPAAIPIWSIAPALACGNCVVWKAPEETPAVSALLYEILREADADGALSLVFADGDSTFEGLAGGLERSLVDKVAFTGTTANGRRVSELCGRRLQR